MIRQHLWRMRVAYAVLALALIPTIGIYCRVRTNVESRDHARFERITREYQAAVQQRIPRYVDEMLGVRGLFAANPSVNADQWRQYVDSLEIGRFYPGIRVLGYLEQVTAEGKGDFLLRMRAEAGPDYQILPTGDRPAYFPTVFTSRFDPDLPARVGGHDHYSVPERREAMDHARDTGQPTATGKVELMGRDANHPTQTGFAIYLPVYHAGAPTTTVAERRVALQGFICAMFEPEQLLTGIFGRLSESPVTFDVFDSPETTPGHLLYNDDKERAVQGAAMAGAPRFVEAAPVPVLNRTWTLRFESMPAFDTESQAYLPPLVLVSALALSFLLFGITWTQVRAREQAEKILSDLKKSETALATEKERLAVTLYSIGEGVITTDTMGRVLSINKVGEQLTGWPQAEATGKPVTELFNVLNERTRERCANPADIVLATGNAADAGPSSILVERDGTERVVAASAAPIRDKTGRVIGVVLVFRDVTERRKSEAELLKESKLESVGLLAGGIAHDFNNALLGIIGNLSLARMDANYPEKMLERLASVEKSALRARELTQQLVMFARGGAPIRQQVQVNNVVKDAAMFALKDTQATCEFYAAPNLWPVDVDVGQFRQVINNIALNAAQAMPDGGEVEVRLENVEMPAGSPPPLGAGRYLRVSIEDHGAGIAPENLPRIFDPYFTTRKHARGLGLASAYAVVRKHDGHILVESRLGRGSIFRIYLPASVAAQPAMKPEIEQLCFVGHGRILIMDDEESILTLLREMLVALGYEVETSRDGVEALQKYQAARESNQPFAAVIMDLTIPEGMGGKEAIRRLREIDPAVKAIVSSGYSYDPVMANFKEYGFSGVMPKPYVMEDLSRTLHEILARDGVGADLASA